MDYYFFLYIYNILYFCYWAIGNCTHGLRSEPALCVNIYVSMVCIKFIYFIYMVLFVDTYFICYIKLFLLSCSVIVVPKVLSPSFCLRLLILYASKSSRIHFSQIKFTFHLHYFM